MNVEIRALDSSRIAVPVLLETLAMINRCYILKFFSSRNTSATPLKHRLLLPNLDKFEDSKITSCQQLYSVNVHIAYLLPVAHRVIKRIIEIIHELVGGEPVRLP